MFLRDKKPVQSFKDFGVVDLETQNRKAVLFGVFSNSEYRCFTGFDGFYSFLKNSRFGPDFYYAHNLGRFDGIYIIEECRKRGIEFQIPIQSNGRIIQLKVLKRVQKSGKKFITFSDSYAVLNLGQAELAKKFGVTEKKDVNFDELNKKALEEVLPIFVQRNESDCRGLFEIMRKAQEYVLKEFSVDLRKCATVSQLALSIYRTRFMTGFLLNPMVVGRFRAESLNPAWEFVMKAYAGGRTEIFDMRKRERVVLYDVNSMYPSVMREVMPVGEFKFLEGVSVQEFMSIVDEYEGFAEVNITSWDQDIPLLWTKQTGKLLFVNFEDGSGVFAFPEIRKALREGFKINSVKRVLFFEHGEAILKEYAEFMYAKRLECRRSGDGAGDFLFKQLGNSLYGKFAQNPRLKEKRILNWDELKKCKTKIYEDGDVFYTVEERFSPRVFFMPQLSAYVTSYARVKLYDCLKRAHEPVYCDTDSVVCDWYGETGEGLGELKRVREWHNFRAFNPKAYQCDEIKKAKGIPFKELEKVKDLGELFDEEKSAEWDSICSLSKSLTAKSNVVYRDGLVKYVRMKRHFEKTYDKRVVLEDGSTQAFWLAGQELLHPLRIFPRMSHKARKRELR